MKFRKMFGYAGGQKNLLPILKELIPSHSTYVEVFGGGCTVMLNKHQSEAEVYNDIDKRLVNLFLVVKDHPEEFKRQISLLPNSRVLFGKFKKDIITEADDVKRAVMFYYLLLNAWSGESREDVSYVSRTENHAKIEQIGWFSNRMRDVAIENLDFEALIKKYDAPDTFLFLDPPYADITDLYQFSFTNEDHKRLAKALKRISGLFLLTYNSHPLIELLYRDYFMFEQEIIATMMPGAKRGAKHLIVANYDIIGRKFKSFSSKFFKF